MDVAAHVYQLAREGELLASAAGAAGLDAPVPTCPGWVVRDLLRHIGGVHRWAATYVREARTTPLELDSDLERLVDGWPADDALVAWFRSGHAALVDALRSAPPDLECWTFLAAPSPLAMWARRQAHETAVHRVDAEAAAGGIDRRTPLPPEFAADGIDELLTCFVTRPKTGLRLDPPRELAVLAEDDDLRAGWLLTIAPRGSPPGGSDRRPSACGAPPPSGGRPSTCTCSSGTASAPTP